jgi:hypothetical protein
MIASDSGAAFGKADDYASADNRGYYVVNLCNGLLIKTWKIHTIMQKICFEPDDYATHVDDINIISQIIEPPTCSQKYHYN